MYDRLYSNAIRSEKLRKEVLSRIKVQEELQGCTFAPQVGWRRSWCFYIRALATLSSATVPCCANMLDAVFVIACGPCLCCLQVNRSSSGGSGGESVYQRLFKHAQHLVRTALVARSHPHFHWAC